MSKKVTGQEVYEAYQQTMTEFSPEKRAVIRVLPGSWEEVSEEDQSLFRIMAWKMNLIVSEFEVN